MPTIRTYACGASLLLCGCSEDPRRAQTLDYLMELRPVVYENRLLADQVLAQGAAIHDGRATTESMTAALETEIVPLAQHVHDLAAAVEPPASVAPDHRALVELWGRRHRAYRSAVEGLHTRDLDAFNDAKKEVIAVTLAEDEWVRAFNAKLQPMDLMVDLVP